jgi:hypothetical protein
VLGVKRPPATAALGAFRKESYEPIRGQDRSRS